MWLVNVFDARLRFALPVPEAFRDAKLLPARQFCSLLFLARLFGQTASKSLFILRNTRSCITEKSACQNKRSEARIFKLFTWPSVFLKLSDRKDTVPARNNDALKASGTGKAG